MLINLHWPMEAFEKADYFRFHEVLAAKEKEDRLVDPMSLL
ncbi:hypothetical protein [Paucilactobacillus oligofermentans]|nr:hypothetical protein [Paucilactobacillus oligofermentans]